jgi:hypothetical protein
MLQERGAKDVRMRAAIVALEPGHPYLCMPVQFATSLKNRILDGGLMGKSELDEAIAECERVASNDIAFIVMTSTQEEKAFLKVAVAAIPRVAEIILG